MKFKITAEKKQIDKMVKDITKEKEEMERKTKHWSFKSLSKMMSRVGNIPLVMLLDFKRTSNTELELYINMSYSQYMNEKKIAKDITERAKSYGSDVKVEV